MSGPGEHSFEHLSRHVGDDPVDADLDMLLDGVAIDPRLVPLVRVVDEARTAAGGPPPSPTPELAAVLTGLVVADDALSPGAGRAAALARRCAPPAPTTAAMRRGVGRVAGRLRAMGVAAKAAVGLALVGAGTAAAGATGVLPDPAVDAVRHAIEVVTPFELPDAGASGYRDHHETPAHDTAAGAGIDSVATSPGPRGDGDPAGDVSTAPDAGTPGLATVAGAASSVTPLEPADDSWPQDVRTPEAVAGSSGAAPEPSPDAAAPAGRGHGGPPSPGPSMGSPPNGPPQDPPVHGTPVAGGSPGARDAERGGPGGNGPQADGASARTAGPPPHASAPPGAAAPPDRASSRGAWLPSGPPPHHEPGGTTGGHGAGDPPAEAPGPAGPAGGPGGTSGPGRPQPGGHGPDGPPPGVHGPDGGRPPPNRH
jgi:hypothetical protein